MSTTRREFVTRMAATAVVGSLPLALDARSLAAMPALTAAPEKWDVSWTGRLTGKYKAIFDVPEIDSGYGVWRASIWGKQYMETLGAAAKDLSPVLVLRHNAIFLAMQQSFWDKYGIGAEKKAMHPLTEQPTDKNPALLSSERQDLPPELDGVALDQYIKRGNVALGCNLAFDEVVGVVQKKDNVSPEEARKQAIASLVPGVILQPSGVFAALHAQDVGCKYLRAS